MAGGKGVKGAREEGHPLQLRHVKFLILHQIIRNKPINMIQRTSPIEKGQAAHLLVMNENEHPLINQEKDFIFFLQRQQL